MSAAGRPGLIKDPVSHRWRRIVRAVHAMPPAGPLGPAIAAEGPPPAPVRSAGADDFASPLLAALWQLLMDGWRSFLRRLMGAVEQVRPAGSAIAFTDADNQRMEKALRAHARVYLASLRLGSTETADDSKALERLRGEDAVGTAFRIGALEAAKDAAAAAAANGDHSAFSYVTEEELRRLAREPASPGGMRPFTFDELAADAAGVPHAAPALAAARKLTLPTELENQLNVIRAQVGARLRPVVYRVGETLVSRLAQADAAIAQQALVRGVQEGLDAPALADIMADLAGDDGAWTRDWLRVARTELARVHNWGHLLTRLQRHPENAVAKGAGLRVPDVLAFKVPQGEDACRYCRAIWMLGDTPRLYPLRQIIANGDNAVGAGGQPRRADALLPTVGPIHPNCLCGPLRFVDDAALQAFPRLTEQIGAAEGGA